MKKDSIVSSNQEAVVVDIDREPYLKITMLGTSYQAVKRNKYVNTKSVELYIPLWALPYVMMKERAAIADYEEERITFLERIKKAFNTEVQPTK